MTRFVRDLAERTDERWDAGILDIHFREKADAVSATARKLAQAWRDHRPESAVEPGIAAFRQGDGVSEHRVMAAGPGEVVEVVHRINHRQAFLAGILASIRFAHAARPGLYSLEDVLRG